jgi:hypothetical protein
MIILLVKYNDFNNSITQRNQNLLYILSNMIILLVKYTNSNKSILNEMNRLMIYILKIVEYNYFTN